MFDKFEKFGAFIKRENRILDTLQEFINKGLEFIVVGGYAVSAYKHRFSVDADIVIKKEDRAIFEEALSRIGFVKTHELNLNHAYASQFISYTLREDLPIAIDLLIDGIGSRTTDASFSFAQLREYSEATKIIGMKKEVVALIPRREILIILKLHSGRLTDFRDIVALSKNLDMELIRKFIWKGKMNIVKKNIQKVVSIVEDEEFIDSFKGVFIEKKYAIDIDEVKRLKELLNRKK